MGDRFQRRGERRQGERLAARLRITRDARGRNATRLGGPFHGRLPGMRRAPHRLLAVLVLVASASACDRARAIVGGGGDGGAGGLLATASSFLGSSFEGEITVQATSPGARAPRTIVLGVKSPRFRADVEGGAADAHAGFGQAAAFIIDPPAKKAWAVDDAHKRAIVIDFAQARAMRGAAGAAGAKAVPGGAPPKIEKTGQKDVVAGYACEIVKSTLADGKRVEVCMAEGLAFFDLADLGVESPEVAALATLSGMNHMPLRIVSFDTAGRETSRVAATRVEKKSLDAARFAVPAGYQTIDMAQMMGGLGAFGAGHALPPGMGRVPPGLPPGIASALGRRLPR